MRLIRKFATTNGYHFSDPMGNVLSGMSENWVARAMLGRSIISMPGQHRRHGLGERLAVGFGLNGGRFAGIGQKSALDENGWPVLVAQHAHETGAFHSVIVRVRFFDQPAFQLHLSPDPKFRD